MAASGSQVGRAVASILRDNDAKRPLSLRLEILFAADEERERDLAEWLAENGLELRDE
jgi:hypothetical protein